MPRALETKNAQVILRLIDGLKERQALDVVPMRMRQQQGQVQRLSLEFSDQVLPEQAHSRAGIEDDDLAIGADFDTGSIAAVLDGARPGRRDGAAHTPELQPRRSRPLVCGGGPGGASGFVTAITMAKLAPS